ncbi:multiple sugar transport system permease protein [Rhizobium rosettiformans]|uniref:Sugar ABC transporter permease n=2 Tax=Rhizobium rosettiformans TaxID=1368430 RepID=A0A4S8PT82_9HYPH|nr:sugar ABC transporter permease [Rhizobium rosettiformans]MBB5277241.1 multiple sugar transport system permease protein [Rhizobium rosettiformans]THV34528.1 sugar ABC transporter permease [Rhizobium rosettiformans W3]
MTIWWRRHRSWLTPALLLAPGLILFLVIIVASSIETFWISFFEWDGIGPKTWIGLGNYVELLDDPQFYTSLKNNVIWLLMFLAAPPAGLAIALLVNQKIAGMRLAKSLFFMPLVLAAVTVGVIFNWFYDPTFGLLAIIYNALGATAPALLSDEHLVTFAVIIAALWPQIAFCLVLFLAGLNNLDEELIGAGRVDGARGWNMLRHVVLPQLTQVAFIAVAITLVGALRSFDLISVMTAGGPFGSSTVLAYQMYEQSIFSYRFGYGAAIATVLFLIMAVFIAWYLRGLIKAEKGT